MLRELSYPVHSILLLRSDAMREMWYDKPQPFYEFPEDEPLWYEVQGAFWRYKIDRMSKLLEETGETYEQRYTRNKYKTDKAYKLARVLRSRLCAAIRGKHKSGSAVRDLGCSIPELMEHLESKFQPRMNWDNHGVKVGHWSIDHIIPLSAFNLEDRDEFLKAVNWTNLQPLWTGDNSTKSNKHAGNPKGRRINSKANKAPYVTNNFGEIITYDKSKDLQDLVHF